jgi:hypothetical protein
MFRKILRNHNILLSYFVYFASRACFTFRYCRCFTVYVHFLLTNDKFLMIITCLAVCHLGRDGELMLGERQQSLQDPMKETGTLPAAGMLVGHELAGVVLADPICSGSRSLSSLQVHHRHPHWSLVPTLRMIAIGRSTNQMTVTATLLIVRQLSRKIRRSLRQQE